MTDVPHKIGALHMIVVAVSLIAIGIYFVDKYEKSESRDKCEAVLAKPIPRPFDCKVWMESNLPKSYEDGSSSGDNGLDIGIKKPTCASEAEKWDGERATLIAHQEACRKNPEEGGKWR